MTVRNLFVSVQKISQQNILEPIFEEETPALYSKGIIKVELHMDKATSHMSHSTAAYLAKKESKTGIKYIPLDERPVKSPDAFPMNFYAFGFLKQALRHLRGVNFL
ncbi:uncharacterized protein TNCV_2469421 [Trichonephila clavipes]|nr:uncharacterized protein TNCV_2469421 [Trichonephila clavipes]